MLLFLLFVLILAFNNQAGLFFRKMLWSYGTFEQEDRRYII